MSSTILHGGRRAFVAGCALALTLGASLAGGAAPAAASGTAADKSGADAGVAAAAWSIELDCAACHEKQAASFETAEEAAGEEAAAESDKAAGEKAADAKDAQADGAATATGAKAGSAETAGATGAQADENDATGEAARLEEITAFAVRHVDAFGLTCATCHEDSPELAAAHDDLASGKQPRKLKLTEVGAETCLTCHDQESLAETTADCAVLTDPNGTVVNPHDLPENPKHTTVACTDCHQVHSPKKTVDLAAQQACTSCHHTGDYACGTCHTVE